MDNWKPQPPPLPLESAETEDPTGENSEPEPGTLENNEAVTPPSAKQRLVESARRSNRTIAEMIKSGLRVADLNEAELERLLEEADPTAKAKRVQIYTYLRTKENFSKAELDELDRFPLSQLAKESRRILAEKARRGATGASEDFADYDDDGPPDVPASRGSYRPFMPVPRNDPLAIVKSPTASKREKERARIEILKQRAQRPRVPRSNV